MLRLGFATISTCAAQGTGGVASQQEHEVYLLFDPYTNRHWSMMDIRLVNKVADAMLSENEHLDPSEIVGAIRNVFRPGMAAEPLRVHATHRLKASRRQRVAEFS